MSPIQRVIKDPKEKGLVSQVLNLNIRKLGRQDYESVWQAMKSFTEKRTSDTTDELWFLEHNPVFTQGQAGKAEHVLAPASIPVIKVDRGGQVTYHGPGQLVVYLLLDVKRSQQGPRAVVTAIEQAIIKLLQSYNVNAYAKPEAPGVYIGDAKISSLGLRFKKQRSYHGLSLNLDMDLEPFSRINPCGYEGLAVTQLIDHVEQLDKESVSDRLLQCLMEELTYNSVKNESHDLPFK